MPPCLWAFHALNSRNFTSVRAPCVTAMAASSPKGMRNGENLKGGPDTLPNLNESAESTAPWKSSSELNGPSMSTAIASFLDSTPGESDDHSPQTPLRRTDHHRWYRPSRSGSRRPVLLPAATQDLDAFGDELEPALVRTTKLELARVGAVRLSVILPRSPYRCLRALVQLHCFGIGRVAL